MTVRTAALQTCDRCLKPFNEKHLSVGDKVPIFKQKGLVVTQTTGTNIESEPKYKILLSFDDLCPDCEKTVTNLIERMKLDGSVNTLRKAPAKKRGSAKRKKAAPEAVKEYSEAPTTESPPKEEPPAKTPEAASKSNGKSNGKTAAAKPAKEGTDGQKLEVVKEEPPKESKIPEKVETKGESEPEQAPVEKAVQPKEVASEDALVEEALKNGSYVKDESTGDVYDAATGEVVVKGTSDAHPF